VTNAGSTPVVLGPGEYRLFTTQALATPLSIDETVADLHSQFVIYPNPAQDSFKVSGEVDQVEIYSLTGQLVKRFTESQRSYSLNSLQSGIYLVRINNEFSQRLVKQ
jgi:hypothetical protein